MRGLSRTAAATARVRKMALDVRKGDEEWIKTKEGHQDRYTQAVEKMRAELWRGNLEDLDMEGEGPEEGEVKRKEWEERLKRRRRAEVILFAVGDQEDPPLPLVSISASIAAIKPTKSYLNNTSNPISTTTTSTTTANNKPQPHPAAATTTTPLVKPKRKRKTRTLAFSSSSSSSSSSSESSSSSSSSSESKREKKAGPKPRAVRRKPIWDTSSSDNDGSSSSASDSS